MLTNVFGPLAIASSLWFAGFAGTTAAPAPEACTVGGCCAADCCKGCPDCDCPCGCCENCEEGCDCTCNS